MLRIRRSSKPTLFSCLPMTRALRTSDATGIRLPHHQILTSSQPKECDIHFAKGIYCTQCHGDMAQVGNPAKSPWVSEPTCGSCHKQRKPSFEFEQVGRLFKDSRCHGGVHCSACHGSPHAIGPAVTAADNAQAIEHQGFAGTITKCTVCHASQPKERFEHKFDN